MTAIITTYAPHSAMPAPAIPSAGTSTSEQDHVDHQAGERGREVARGHLGAAGDDQEHHPQAVQRPAERHPGQRLVGVVERRRGQQAQDPAPEQRQAGHDQAADQQVVGGHQSIQSGSLGIIADRVGERRPRVLERAHDEGHRAGELDRDRVQAGQPRATRW